MFTRPGANSAKVEWGPNEISGLLQGLVRSLPPGRERQFFEGTLASLQPGTVSSGHELILQPLPASNKETIILIDTSSIPAEFDMSEAVLTPMDAATGPKLLTGTQDNFIYLINKEDNQPLTYHQAYVLLGLKSISALKIRFTRYE